MMLIVYGLALILSLSILSYFFLDHVKNRIDSFLGNADTYQIDLSLMAFKSGGIFGKGPGQGDLKEKIPDANTDFIFAVAGEELGLIFCFVILIIILSIVIKTLLKVLKVDNPYKIIAISGLICSFGLQSLINILSMGDHGFYVWIVVIVLFTILGSTIILLNRKIRQAKKEINEEG